jgi:hypothetical protein
LPQTVTGGVVPRYYKEARPRRPAKPNGQLSHAYDFTFLRETALRVPRRTAA